jgi:cyanocobalamin reductase (cyanide-eliminating) / alkylcobalamin dealkylase
MAEHTLIMIVHDLLGDGFDLVARRGLAPIRFELEQLGIVLPQSQNPLGLVIGNTRAIWPKFLAALHERPELLACEHPLDQWVEERISSAVFRSGANARSYFTHRRLHEGYLPLQRWAERLGFLALSPSHLSVHRDYGPWIALRALVIVDVETDESSAEPAATEPCGSCTAPCREPFARVSRQSEQQSGTERVVSHWKEWLAVREACPVGREFRYSDEQIRYHYGRDRTVLLPRG